MDLLHFSKAGTQRQVVVLQDPTGNSIEVRYEPANHALRLKSGSTQRLFFYEADQMLTSKASLLNEYGYLVGRLVCRSANTGMMQFYADKLSFEIIPAQARVVLSSPALKQPFVYQLPFLLDDNSNPDPSLLRSVLLVIGWLVIAA